MKNVYLIEADLGEWLGKSFIETDRFLDSRAKVVSLIRSGEIRPLKIIEICEDDGWVRDVTESIQAEVALAEAEAEAEAEADCAARAKAAHELFQMDHARDYRKQGE